MFSINFMVDEYLSCYVTQCSGHATNKNTLVMNPVAINTNSNESLIQQLLNYCDVICYDFISLFLYIIHDPAYD